MLKEGLPKRNLLSKMENISLVSLSWSIGETGVETAAMFAAKSIYQINIYMYIFIYGYNVVGSRVKKKRILLWEKEMK